MNQGQSAGHAPELSEKGLLSIDQSRSERDVIASELDNRVLVDDGNNNNTTNDSSAVKKRLKVEHSVEFADVVNATAESAQNAVIESAPPASGMNAVAFCKLLGVLKHLPRAGWLRHRIEPSEPVAGHMYRMAVLAMCLDRRDLDQNKCIKMALVHDMAESIVGDITPHCGISAEEKTRREDAAMQRIATLLPQKLGDEMYSLWREYETQHSEEAKAVKQLDRFDLIMQAYEYEQEAGKPKFLDEFYNSSSTAIKQEPMLSWMKQLLHERNKNNMAAPSAEPKQNDGGPKIGKINYDGVKIDKINDGGPKVDKIYDGGQEIKNIDSVDKKLGSD